MLLYAATSNAGKLREFSLAAELSGAHSQGSLRVLPVPGFDRISACDESGATFEENARRKAEHYSRWTEGLVFADDSGLEVAALGGEPGVRSARYAGPRATDEENRRKLLAALAGVPPARRAARFVCVIALAERGKVQKVFEGTAEGRILEATRGAGGFGYDPLFFFPALDRTFAELAPEEKLAHSHRGAAFRQMAAFLGSKLERH